MNVQNVVISGGKQKEVGFSNKNIFLIFFKYSPTNPNK